MIPILWQEKLYTKVHLIQTTHQKGRRRRRRRHSHFQTAKIRGKASILILIHARAKNIQLYRQTFILTGFEALGRLIQFYYSTQIARR